uniref:pentatricopeptide repeat-containing protein At1g62910-like n=1 Tax=Erigeron canadensis TaxID=72917 RepID=UPI001CB8DD26|nr:pentatricopeptide repeat-containing protein At1g62910-like [Erigeron canadensis]
MAVILCRFDHHLIKGFKAAGSSLLAPWSNVQHLGHKSLHSRSSCLDCGDTVEYVIPGLKDMKVDDVLNKFNGLTQTRPLPCVCKFNQLLDDVFHMEHYPHSVQLFKQMCAIGVPVDECTAKFAIQSYSGMNEIRQGFAVLGYCFKLGIEPDISSYNTLLNWFVTNHRTHDAETLFKKLFRINNDQFDLYTYNAMIKGLCKIGNHFTAIGLLRLMRNGESPKLKPSYDEIRTVLTVADTYDTIIDGLCQDVTMIDDAFKLFKELGSWSRVTTINSLIYALCMSGRWGDVSRMLRKVRDARMYPTAETFDILDDASQKQGKQCTFDALIIMRNCGFDIDTDLLTRSVKGAYFKRNKLLAGNSKYGMVDEAMNMYSVKVETTNCDFFINNTARSQRYADFTARVILQSKSPPFDKQQPAAELFYLSKRKSLDHCRHRNYEVVDFLTLHPHADVHGMIIDFASSIGKFDVSRLLFQDLLFERGLPPPTVKTYGVMIRGFCRRGLLKDAKRLFDEMEKRGCEPDILIFNDLIQGYLENKPLHDVISFLEELHGRGYSVSETISNPNIMKLIDQLRYGAANIPDNLLI